MVQHFPFLCPLSWSQTTWSRSWTVLQTATRQLKLSERRRKRRTGAEAQRTRQLLTSRFRSKLENQRLVLLSCSASDISEALHTLPSKWIIISNCCWGRAHDVRHMPDGDLIGRVRRRMRGPLVRRLGWADRIAGGFWERARSLMDHEVDAHYPEIACRWRTRGPVLLCIYSGSQANRIQILSCHDGSLKEFLSFHRNKCNVCFTKLSWRKLHHHHHHHQAAVW